MTDATSRFRQRRATRGDVARARWLRQRQRLGQVTSTHTRLAAQLGDPAARLLVPAEAIPVRPHRAQVQAWKRAFRAAGRRPLVLLGWAAGREVLAVCEDWQREPDVYLPSPEAADVERLRHALERVGAWLQRPTARRRAAVKALQSVDDWFQFEGNLAGQRVRRLADRLVDAVLDWPAETAVRDVLDARLALRGWARRWTRERGDADAGLGQVLIDWLLEGRCDWSLAAVSSEAPTTTSGPGDAQETQLGSRLSLVVAGALIGGAIVLGAALESVADSPRLIVLGSGAVAGWVSLWIEG